MLQNGRHGGFQCLERRGDVSILQENLEKPAASQHDAVVAGPLLHLVHADLRPTVRVEQPLQRRPADGRVHDEQGLDLPVVNVLLELERGRGKQSSALGLRVRNGAGVVDGHKVGVLKRLAHAQMEALCQVSRYPVAYFWITSVLLDCLVDLLAGAVRRRELFHGCPQALDLVIAQGKVRDVLDVVLHGFVKRRDRLPGLLGGQSTAFKPLDVVGAVWLRGGLGSVLEVPLGLGWLFLF
jgi:hypothetical protein